MKRRRRHGLDLLPLLDVFMVVLFVFATIQEQQLDTSQQAQAILRSELASAQAQAQARPEPPDPAVEQALRSELAQARDEAVELRDALARLRRAAESAAATGTTGGAEVLRRQEVLNKLVDHFSVFEIEIDGRLVDGVIHNRCCYRTEPMSEQWLPCGEAPAATTELRDWLAEGGGGLVDALRRTKGGNAMTIVRQNELATYRIGRKLEEQLRERFPEHKIYDEGVATHSLACCD
ncbi:MAG TPA: hypothetical protein VGB85_08785 [Nannocystis sp.]